MAIHHLAIATNQAWDFEAKYTDGLAHAINRGVVFPWVSWIGPESVDRPKFDVRRRNLRGHTRTFRVIKAGEPSEAAPVAPA